jgi:hypothetical protein
MEKQCKYCSMMVPKESYICPYCKKRINTSPAALFFTAILVIGIITSIVSQNTQKPNSGPEHDSLESDAVYQYEHTARGNNTEAEDFAKRMTRIGADTWPKGNATWHLELTPQKISGIDIVNYRKNVSYCKATISINRPEWINTSKAQQRDYVKSSVNVLHKPPNANESKELDYYPNSTGEVSILVDNKVVATGKYSRTELNIVLEPLTSKEDIGGK